MRRIKGYGITFALISVVAFPFFTAASLEQTPSGSTALDGQCTDAYDYSCKVGEKSTSGKPCGQGLPAQNIYVKGICVAAQKAEETSYLNADGQWTPSSSQGSASSGTANSGTMGASAPAQTASGIVSAPAAQPLGQSTPAQESEPAQQNSIPQADTLSSGSSVMQSAMGYMTGADQSQSAAESDNNSAAPNSNSTLQSWVTGAQTTLQPGDFPESGNPGEVQGGGAESNENPYTPAPSLSQTLSSPMGSLQGLTNADVESENSSAMQTPSEQAEQGAEDIQAVQSGASTFGQSALYPTDQGSQSGEQEASSAFSSDGGMCFSDGRCFSGITQISPNSFLSNPARDDSVIGQASYFGGNTSSSGISPNANPNLAASMFCPNGCILQVTNPQNGDSQYVAVGDTGPNPDLGNRVVDLSPSAFNSVGFNTSAGVGTVQVNYVGYVGGDSTANNVQTAIVAAGYMNSGMSLNDAVAAAQNNLGTNSSLVDMGGGGASAVVDPWSESPASLASVVQPQISGPVNVNDYSDYASAQEAYLNTPPTANSSVFAEGSVPLPTPSPVPEIDADMYAQAEAGESIAGETEPYIQPADWNDIAENYDQNAAEAAGQNTAAEQSSEAVAYTEPNPVGEVTSSPLPAPTDWDALANDSELAQAESQTQNDQQAALDLREQQADDETAQYQQNINDQSLALQDREAQADEETAAYANEQLGESIANETEAYLSPNSIVADDFAAFGQATVPPELLQETNAASYPFDESSYSIPQGLLGGTSPGQLSFAQPTAGAPSFDNSSLPSWANTVVGNLQSTESSLQQDYQALANEFSQPAPQAPAPSNSTNNAGANSAPVPLPLTSSTYQGVSIVDYLNSIGEDFSFTARQALAASYGIANYVGSAAQNLQLLSLLRGF